MPPTSRQIGYFRQLGVDLFEFLVNDLIGAVPFRSFRQLFYHLVLGRLGRQVVILRGVRFIKPRNVFIADNVIINRDAIIDGRGGVVLLGQSADVGEAVWIWTMQHNPDDNDHGVTGGPVTIGDHCWLAPRSIVLPGVTLGRGCVVGTGAVVSKSFEEKCVLGGVPAKILPAPFEFPAI